MKTNRGLKEYAKVKFRVYPCQYQRESVFNEKGQVVIIILGIMIIFLIFIPALVYYLQQDMKWTVRQKRTTTAFHLAEAGVDRGYWKLVESSVNWDTVINGSSLGGYDGNTVYMDIPNTGSAVGEYKIRITSYAPNEALVRAWGRDSSANEVRCIEVILTRTPKEASMYISGGLEYKPNLKVHWGPVVSYTEIDQSPSDYWPRKYSKGKITGRDTDQNPPNTDGLEYWAYDDTLSSPAEVNLSSYAALAQVSRITAPETGTSSPTGSGYFVGNAIFGKTKDYTFSNSTSVIYVTGNAELGSKCFLNVKAVVAEGNVDFNADEGDYTAVIPANAEDEYEHPNAQATWDDNFAGSSTYLVEDCGMVGFLYVGGNLNTGAGGAKIVGVLNVKGETSINTFTIYYSTNCASEINYSWSPIRRKSWREVNLSW